MLVVLAILNSSNLAITLKPLAHHRSYFKLSLVKINKKTMILNAILKRI